MFAGLPVAAWSGTLDERFGEAADRKAAAGVVRAKTGTLTGNHAMAGMVTTVDGRLLAFSILTDGVTASSDTTPWRPGPDRRDPGGLRLSLTGPALAPASRCGAGGVLPGYRGVMAQFVDWDLAAATAGALGKIGPSGLIRGSHRGGRRSASADRRGGWPRQRLHGPALAGRPSAGAGRRPPGLGRGQHRRACAR